MTARGRSRTLDVRLIAMVALTGVISIFNAAQPTPATSATPATIRSCVVKNLPRYTVPDSAVMAQYADIATTCEAALDKATSSVRFRPDRANTSGRGTQSRGGDSATTSPSAVTVQPRTPRDGGTSAASRRTPPRRGATASGRAAPAPHASPGSTEAASSQSATLVQQAIERAGPGVEGPLPSSLTGIPAWLLGLAAAVIGLIAAAVAARVHQRPR